jgi:hypothetical protein
MQINIRKVMLIYDGSQILKETFVNRKDVEVPKDEKERREGSVIQRNLRYI